jgi:hypothetical protein
VSKLPGLVFGVCEIYSGKRKMEMKIVKCKNVREKQKIKMLPLE